MTTQNTQADPAAQASELFAMIWPGGLAAQAVYCAAKLKIADILAKGPNPVAAIAEVTKTDSAALHRLLRALCSLKLLRELPGGDFELTPLGQTLQSDHPSGTRPWAVMLGAPFIWRPWGQLLKTVRSGEPAFPRMHDCSMYEYLAKNPRDAEIYNAAMNAGATTAAAAIVESYDFSQFDTIVDLGGGQGSLLKGILEANPTPRGILFDLPAVVETANNLRNSSVGGRCELVGGDFFQSVPPGADAYLLKGIIHGFNDEHATKILTNIKTAMRPDGKILIVDVVLSESNEPIPQKALMDLMMLTLVEGRERTEPQFRSLLQNAGLQLQRIVDTNGGNAIVEAVPA